MFNFFRRARKDPENDESEKTKKGDGCSKKQGTSGCNEISNENTDGVLEEMLPMPIQVSSLASGELREKCVVGIPFPDGSSKHSDNNIVVTGAMTSVDGVNVGKKHEPRQNVKPCGHGTLAIAPRSHLVGSKRETPPSSPIQEPKIYKKRSNTTPDLVEIGLLEKNRNGDYASITPIDLQEQNEKSLINQEAKFQSQLNDLRQELKIRDAEANKLRFQMEELQRNVFAKSAGMDRLQTELQAANKESEMTKIRIRHLETDLTNFRERSAFLAEELGIKSDEMAKAETKAQLRIEELQEVIRQLRTRVSWLEQQIESLKQEKKTLENEYEKIKILRLEDEKRAEEAYQQLMRQKSEAETKWKSEFEKLRSINIMKEQDLLDDFEWKLREVQLSCKKRLEEKDKAMESRLLDAYRESEEKMKEAETIMEQLSGLKHYETEVLELRGLTKEQANALQEMRMKQEEMRAAETSLKCEAERLRKMIDTEKENIYHVQRLHHQELLDKERKLQNTLDEKRLEISMYWEEKLLHEISRLKEELEQIYAEEEQTIIKRIRDEKDKEFQKAKKDWEVKVQEYSFQIELLKRTIDEKDLYFQEEIERKQSKTDQDIMDLRRLMDKIDMTHHERFEKTVLEHEKELEILNKETEQRIKEVEFGWQQQITNLRKNMDMMKEQMEQEYQQSVALLTEKHRLELSDQWESLMTQNKETVLEIENDYIGRIKELEEKLSTQQALHQNREDELMEEINSMRKDTENKNCIISDLQNNIDTLEGGIQVLNREIAQQCEDLSKARHDSDIKLKSLLSTIQSLQQEKEAEKLSLEQKLSSVQKQNQETIDNLQRRCNCLTKLFEEVRLRYERRESRPEDLNIITDLRQVIAEQEKDLACVNEEKRYFQMRLIALENEMKNCHNDDQDEIYESPEEYELSNTENTESSRNNACSTSSYPVTVNGLGLSIPPTIQECDDYEECLELE